MASAEPAAARSSYDRIYAVVRKIPAGRVATYGQVAERAGLPRRARLVGYALHALPRGTRVPWHRVVNASGKLSLARTDTGAGMEQRFRLEREGVVVLGGRVALKEYGWRAR